MIQLPFVGSDRAVLALPAPQAGAMRQASSGQQPQRHLSLCSSCIHSLSLAYSPPPFLPLHSPFDLSLPVPSNTNEPPSAPCQGFHPRKPCPNPGEFQTSSHMKRIPPHLPLLILPPILLPSSKYLSKIRLVLEWEPQEGQLLTRNSRPQSWHKGAWKPHLLSDSTSLCHLLAVGPLVGHSRFLSLSYS